MRLSKIKLSGFKSFVDPTTLSFPGNLMGVVGPNGCGKSNIIDAVRWVLGESSAKTLRGDSMADVIFNGSSGRKPVGQAGIELVFDNGDGKITGAYAGYSEIALKRVVSRDGTSQYFLNNAKCRRKDITNLLLGTGVGSHGYSIIEQGMISRLVEAKPEDLRAFLEEAAGISKYKERRRETEHRIRHTRENLERLEDLREELGKQLGHLQRQARAAERFKVLKAEERRTGAELLLLRLKVLDAENAADQRELAGRQNAFEAQLSEQRRIEAEIEKLRLGLTEDTEQFNSVQGNYYRVGAEIARLEQAIQHRNSDIRRQQAELAQTEEQLDKVSGHISDDEVALEQIEELLARLNPELEQAQAQLRDAESHLVEAERAAETSRDRSEETAAAMAAAEQSMQVESARLEHYHDRLERIEVEIDERQNELAALDDKELETQLETSVGEEEAIRGQTEQASRTLELTSEEIQRLRNRDSALAASLDGIRQQLQRDKGRLSSLEELQRAALGRLSDDARRWLDSSDCRDALQLAARLDVEPGWERAVEAAVSGYLNAIEAERLEAVAAELETLSESGLALLERGTSEATGRRLAALEPLADHIRGPDVARSLVAGIFAAPDLESALSARSSLAPGQSIITQDGIEVSRHALRTHTRDDPQLGVIARAEEIEKLQASVGRLSRENDEQSAELDALRRRLEELEQRRAGELTEARDCKDRHAEAKTRLETRRSRLDDVRVRLRALTAELENLASERESIAASIEESQARLNQSRNEREARAASQAGIDDDRRQAVERLRKARSATEAERERVKEMTILVESRRTSKQSASAALERVQAQQGYLVERRGELVRQIEELEAPLSGENERLRGHLDERLAIETRLSEARAAVETTEERIRDAERSRSEAQQSVSDARDATEAARMKVRETEVRADTVREQFAETGFDRDELVEELADEASVDSWGEKLDSIGRKIQRLGAINLAAIDEFEEQSERKEYLDRQNEDLTESLATLESAIRKIDSETRARFRDTFNRANQGLGELFPRLFGGGQAYLELDSDDLLAAGVTVMARPPGKRISTIHLLSGGEKALTAVALVFAIFKLNPAPFCLLDEVDAPLDDANVGRFCDIVREMSDHVQFVIITHNKTTMESMGQLAGVTMHEPGVSRLVAVDIDEAVQLAAM